MVHFGCFLKGVKLMVLCMSWWVFTIIITLLVIFFWQICNIPYLLPLYYLSEHYRSRTNALILQSMLPGGLIQFIHTSCRKRRRIYRIWQVFMFTMSETEIHLIDPLQNWLKIFLALKVTPLYELLLLVRHGQIWREMHTKLLS